MTKERSASLCAALVLLVPSLTFAQAAPEFRPGGAGRDPWHVCWTDACRAPAAPAVFTAGLKIPLTLPEPAVESADLSAADESAQRPRAIEYSQGYQVRRKIHRYASFATLPLFGAELALGQSLYNNTPSRGSSRKGLHAAVGAGIVGLFGVNTVTGAWNMFGEGRKDPHGRTLRLVHGLLMMAADAGFVATTMSAPSSERFREALTYEADKSTHRNLAIASISIGTAGYLLMLFGNR